MKQLITIAIVFGSLSAMAQTKPPTKPDKVAEPRPVAFTEQEISGLEVYITAATDKIHQTHMDSMRRDTLDNLLGTIYNLIKRRAEEAAKPKAEKKGEKH